MQGHRKTQCWNIVLLLCDQMYKICIYTVVALNVALSYVERFQRVVSTKAMHFALHQQSSKQSDAVMAHAFRIEQIDYNFLLLKTRVSDELVVKDERRSRF